VKTFPELKSTGLRSSCTWEVNEKEKLLMMTGVSPGQLGVPDAPGQNGKAGSSQRQGVGGDESEDNLGCA
jgi:hypothetical protein